MGSILHHFRSRCGVKLVMVASVSGAGRSTSQGQDPDVNQRQHPNVNIVTSTSPSCPAKGAGQGGGTPAVLTLICASSFHYGRICVGGFCVIASDFAVFVGVERAVLRVHVPGRHG
jgi:hypothetical protein